MMVKNLRPHLIAQNFSLAHTNISANTVYSFDMYCHKD